MSTLGPFSRPSRCSTGAESSEDYLEAAALYQEILDDGVVSGAVLYNQGNAYTRAGRRGRAIAAYRQARRYRPRDPYLEANLRYALGGEETAGRPRPVIEYVLFWQDWLSYPAKFRLVGLLVGLTIALGLVALFVLRRLFTVLAIAGAVVAVPFILSAAYDWYRCDYCVAGVIVEEEVAARKGDGTGYEPAFTEPLTRGTELRVIGRRGGWLSIRMPAGQEGWVPEEAAVTY